MVKTKTFVTCDSRVVPHRSTEQAQGCLTSEFGWDPVFSPWYERMMRVEERCGIPGVSRAGGSMSALLRGFSAILRVFSDFQNARILSRTRARTVPIERAPGGGPRCPRVEYGPVRGILDGLLAQIRAGIPRIFQCFFISGQILEISARNWSQAQRKPSVLMMR